MTTPACVLPSVTSACGFAHGVPGAFSLTWATYQRSKEQMR